MNCRLILLIAAVCLAVQGIPVESEAPKEKLYEAEIKGYYWKDFDGATIPQDALKAGIDNHGNEVYIGQALHNGILIPGKISKGEKELTFEWGHSEHRTEKNIKILCTLYPEQYEWIKTDVKEIKALDKKFITGGYEPGNGETTYIGRISSSDNSVDVGKLLVSDNEFAGLHTTKDGQGIQHTEFEALSYNPEIPVKRLINRSGAEDNTNIEKDTKDIHVPSEPGCSSRVININFD